jgi:enoyl-CoA hydratase
MRVTNAFTVHQDETAAHVTFDDGRYNVFTLANAIELLEIINRLDATPSLRVLYLAGNIRTFSAGVDIHILRAGGPAADQLLDIVRKILTTMYASRLRIISICTGHAVAAGAMLLLVSDYRIGVRGNVKICFSEVTYGIALNELAILLVKDRISVDQQYQATVLGKMFDSEEARNAGFLDDLAVDLQQAQDKAVLMAATLSDLDDDAYLTTLRSVRGATLAKLQSYEWA